MLKSRILTAVLAISLLFSTVLTAETASANSLLKTIPADAMFVVRLNNFDDALGQMDSYLAGVSPMPLTMMARGYLAQILGSPMLTGINMQGSFAIFGSLSPDSTIAGDDFVKILIPITDYNQFIEASAAISIADANGISKLTIIDPPYALVAKVGNYALVGSSDNYERFLASTKSLTDPNAKTLASVLDVEDAAISASAPLWAYGNVQSASTTFGPMLNAKLEQFKQMMVAQNQPAAKVMDIYFGVLEILMDEVNSASLTLTPKADSLTVSINVNAVPDTYMAKMFATPTTPQTANKLLPYLEDGALINFACKLNTPFWEELQLSNLDFISFLKDEDINDTDFEKMETIIKDTMKNMGTSMVCSVSLNPQSDSFFQAKYVFDVKDPNALNNLISQSTRIWNNFGINDMYKELGIDMDFKMLPITEDYDGVTIYSANLDMVSTDPNSEQGKMINTMYGGGFEYKWAFIDKTCVATIGLDIKKTIDLVKAANAIQTASEI